MKLQSQKIKKSLAKEYLILISILGLSFVIAYLIFPIWNWNDYTKESIRIFDWELFWWILGISYVVRLIILSVNVLKPNE